MASRSSPPDTARAMLRDLLSAEALRMSLEETAPVAVAAAGGAAALVAERGRPTGAWFWSIAPMPDALWETISDEHQVRHRANPGEG